MSKSELHDWECEIEELSGNNADKMLGIARDIYKTAFVRGRNSMTWEQTRWTPVSERLPENKTYVLTTIKVPNRIAHTRSGWYESGFFHNDNGDVWRATDMEVIAWMPLPEPYKAESEE